MAEIGIKASGTKEVLTAADDELDFSSAFRHPRIWKSGAISGTSETLTNDLGYPIRTQGYIKTGSAYYYYFDKEDTFTGNLDNGDYGQITSNDSSIFLTADVSGTLKYVLFVDPAVSAPSSPVNLSKGDVGFQFTKNDDDILSVDDYLKSLTSEYQMLKIVQEGDVTVNARECNAPCPAQTVQCTDFVDVTHNLGYAAHIILYGEWGRKSIGFIPQAIGFMPPIILTEEEVSIDSSKIRFRISRAAESGGIAFCTASNNAAKDYKFHYFLTDYRLPS